MNRKPGDNYRKAFQLFDPTTGLPADCAYGNPFGYLIRNGDRDNTALITSTRIELGRYKLSGTIPAGYTSGDLVQVELFIELGTLDHSIIVDEFLLDAKLTSDLQDVSAANVKTQAMLALTDQGYTPTRAGYLDRLDAAISTVAASVWDALTAGFAKAGSIGKKLADWALGADNRVLLSTDVHTSNVTIYGLSVDGTEEIRTGLATSTDISTLQTTIQDYGDSHWATVSSEAVADAVLQELVADHEAATGSLAAYLKGISTAVDGLAADGVDVAGYKEGQDPGTQFVDFVLTAHDARANDTLGSVLRDIHLWSVGRKAQNMSTKTVILYEKDGVTPRLEISPTTVDGIRQVTPNREI